MVIGTAGFRRYKTRAGLALMPHLLEILQSYKPFRHLTMKLTAATVALVSFLAVQVSAICPGANYGLGQSYTVNGGITNCMLTLLL